MGNNLCVCCVKVKKGHGNKIPHGHKNPPKGAANAAALVIGVEYENYDELLDPAEGYAYANIKNNTVIAEQFADLCRRSKIDVTYLSDGQGSNPSTYPTKENVLASIQKIGATLDANDMFVLYYAGLGAKV